MSHLDSANETETQTAGTAAQASVEPPERQPDSVIDNVLIRLEGDFGEDGMFGRRTLEVTGTVVRAIEPGGAVSFQIPIRDVKHARNEPLVGGGRLELTTNRGEIVPVIAYSLTVAAKFSEAARGIEQLAKGEPLSVNLKEERVRCAKCARLLPEKDGVCPACVNRNATMLRVGAFLKPYKKQAAILVGYTLISTGLTLIPPMIQGRLIDGVMQSHRNLTLLFTLMSAWLAILAVSIIVQVKANKLVAYLSAHIAGDLRQALYRAIEYLQVTFFDKKQVGAITSRVTQDTDRVWGFLVDGVPYFVSNGLLLFGVAILLFLTSWKLTLCILAPIPVVVAISGAAWKTVSNLYYRVGQKWARFHMHLNESLTGIRGVKAFAQEDWEHSKFQVRNEELMEAGVRADSRWFVVFGAMSFFASLGTLINWTVGGWMVYAHQLTLGEFVRVNQLLTLVFGPLQWFAMVNNWFSRAMAGADRIFEIMDMEKEAYLKPGVEKVIEGEVEFDSVRFGYDKSNPVLKGLSFTAKPGDMIGLVGKSGAGKSTTINLLCRFYEPDAGAIKIDGVDYRDLSLTSMRQQIGIVLQEPFLFNGTIAENIAYGKPGATFEEIVAASKAANAHNFVLGKPDGYDTMVGEKGAKLSGGERQRVSIARAILHNPRILILDEATSSVDVETEKQIQEAIGRLIEGRTTFAIAHRLSTLRNANRLIVLDKGEIVETGTHSELMEKKGVFYNLVETQSAVSQIIGIAG
jgi:ATP-binding cassette, subfamily B, bacterial